MSNNLGATVLTTNQANKETTINNMVGILDAAVTAVTNYSPDTDNAQTITADELRANQVFAFDDAGSPSGDVAVTIDSGVQRGLVAFDNASGQNIVVKVSGQSGSGVTIATGVAALVLVYNDHAMALT